MITIFKDWIKIIESSGSKVEEVKDGFKVIGDVILINCGLTHIPKGLREVDGTLDISLNPIESFECDLIEADRIFWMGSKTKYQADQSENSLIKVLDNHSEGSLEKIEYFISNHISIAIGTSNNSDIQEYLKFRRLRKKLPEVEGLFE